MKNINEVILNPVRMRIIQDLSTGKRVTTTEICDRFIDVPRTSMYRHIKILIDSNILTVVSEKKIRGSLERTIALNLSEITKHNTIENGAQNAFGFLMSNYAKFHRYYNGKNPDPAKDKIFLNNTIMMLSDDEFNQFLTELRDLILRYKFDNSKERQSRDISIISAPDEEK